MCKMLDAEFALVLYNSKDNSIMAARDLAGIRPMFYGYTKKIIKFLLQVKQKH